ncbi:hypothetical protein CANARDRAFT_27482 [[Candida] arabinofermentans NRRL YB-2248]|uniref:Uncharacterized protein n=1 Tax=[Candida] arabinofermentans NRRL YB-2248 TaxID=983967 RepID=A0A1E4T3C8_9ASCO|nr:hypothetical protein CANARDRAFT_27482 [[Candida] arabinofermentans NRRL YB-2248]
MKREKWSLDTDINNNNNNDKTTTTNHSESRPIKLTNSGNISLRFAERFKHFATDVEENDEEEEQLNVKATTTMPLSGSSTDSKSGGHSVGKTTDPSKRKVSLGDPLPLNYSSTKHKERTISRNHNSAKSEDVLPLSETKDLKKEQSSPHKEMLNSTVHGSASVLSRDLDRERLYKNIAKLIEIRTGQTQPQSPVNEKDSVGEIVDKKKEPGETVPNSRDGRLNIMPVEKRQSLIRLKQKLLDDIKKAEAGIFGSTESLADPTKAEITQDTVEEENPEPVSSDVVVDNTTMVDDKIRELEAQIETSLRPSKLPDLEQLIPTPHEESTLNHHHHHHHHHARLWRTFKYGTLTITILGIVSYIVAD